MPRTSYSVARSTRGSQETNRGRSTSQKSAQIVNVIDTDDEDLRQTAFETSLFNVMAAGGTMPEVFEEFIATDERKVVSRKATELIGDQEVDGTSANLSNESAYIVIASKEKRVRILEREETLCANSENLQNTTNVSNESAAFTNDSNSRPEKADTNSNAEANVETSTSVDAATYKCWNCPEKLVHAIDLKNHVKLHSKTGGKLKVECEKCFKGFKNQKALCAHVRSVHFSFRPPQEKVKCDNCSKDFVDEDTLRRHMQRVHLVEEEKTFVCEKCGERFVREWLLNEHKGFKHPKEEQTNLKCDKCPEVFKSLRNLLKHLDRFHNPNRVKNMKEKPTKPVDVPDGKRFQCTKCIKTTTFANELIFEAHEGYHTTGYYKCPKCSKKYRKMTYLRGHLIKAHPSEINEYWACEKCSMKFGSVYRLRTHMGDMHKIYKCKKCSENYPSMLLLRFHENDAHLMEEHKTLACSKCPKKFALPIVLWYHSKKYHGPTNQKAEADNGSDSDTDADIGANSTEESSEYEPYKMSDIEDGDLFCKICKNTFDNQIMLQAHLNFHMTRYHPCYWCPEKFRRRMDLRTHIWNVHPAVDIAFKNCPKCTRMYDDTNMFKKHLLRVHESHLCYVQKCTESFRSLLSLELHRNNVHLEEDKKTHACEKCSEKFSTDEVLQYHLKKAHNIGGSQTSATGSENGGSDSARMGNARKRVKLTEIEATTSTSEEYSSAVTTSEEVVTDSTSSIC